MTRPDDIAPIDVLALGVVVRISVPSPEVAAAVERAWRQLRVVDGRSPDAAVTVPALPPGFVDALPAALRTLTQSVTTTAITARRGSILMFHAGGLSHPETGATVAFVAPGGTGKTTLVRTLGRGRGYVTDETVGVELDGTVVPYPKPLSLRRVDGGGKDEVSPLDLGLTPVSVTPWLAGIVLLQRDAGEGQTVTRDRLGLLDAVVRLAPETSSLSAVPTPLRSLAELVTSVGVDVVRYREADDLEPIVADVLGRAR